jgi:hypothetical protein
VAYLDYPGSGNETARHAAAGGPITIMVCAFDADNAAIVRLLARHMSLVRQIAAGRRTRAESTRNQKAPRQVIEIEIEQTMTSAAMALPVMTFVQRDGDRSNRGRKVQDAVAALL